MVRGSPEEALDDCMARLAQGDRDAFEPLFRALHPRAVRLARARLPADQAEDCAQSILMRVFFRASEFEPGRPALPWFYAIASNELRTATRRRAALERRTVEEQRACELAAEDAPERELLERELHACLVRAIDALDDASAEAIRAMLKDAPPPSLRAPAFRKRVSRAYARLRLLLGGVDAR